MLSSKSLNQNMLKIHYLKKIAKLWGLRPQILAILPTPNVLLENVLIMLKLPWLRPGRIFTICNALQCHQI